MTYTYKSEYTGALKALRNSRKLKIKHGWSRDIGSGFIAQDITRIAPLPDGLGFLFSWGTQTIKIADLNLRETEETIKWLELRISEPNDEYFFKKLQEQMQ
ncbi:MAG: hypothetical protein WC365_09145 [Candidatus Babeliales bacterium]|jgi:hypothetical protein